MAYPTSNVSMGYLSPRLPPSLPVSTGIQNNSSVVLTNSSTDKAKGRSSQLVKPT